jgi:hypothetical protein
MRVRIAVDLSELEMEALHRPVVGSGGFQSLLRRLQGNLLGRTLLIDLDDVERVLRYASQYGEGGFQGRLRTALVRDITKIVQVARPYV